MTLFLIIEIHECVIQSVDVVCSSSKGLRNFDHRVSGKGSFLQKKGVFRGELRGDIRFQVHRCVTQQLAGFVVARDFANALPKYIFKGG